MITLFVESLDCDNREKALRFISTRQYAFVPPSSDAGADAGSSLDTFAAMVDTPDPRPEPCVVSALELLAVPSDLRTLVGTLNAVMARSCDTPRDRVVLIVDSEANSAFEAAVSGGKRLNTTLEDFYDLAREDPEAVVRSMIPEARIVRVRPMSDTLSMSDLWGIDKTLASMIDASTT